MVLNTTIPAKETYCHSDNEGLLYWMLEVADEGSQVFKRGLHVSVCFWVKIAFMVNIRAGANLPNLYI